MTRVVDNVSGAFSIRVSVGAVTMTTTLLRAVSALAAAGLLVGMLSACTPEAEPTPEPTKTAAFATDEEAFAAAEETYRAFVHENSRPDGDEEAYLAGIALKEHLKGEQQLKDAGIRGVGEAVVKSFDIAASSLSADRTSLTAEACVDITAVRVLDTNGHDVTPESRPTMIATRVEMEFSGSQFLIYEDLDRDNAECAA